MYLYYSRGTKYKNIQYNRLPHSQVTIPYQVLLILFLTFISSVLSHCPLRALLQRCLKPDQLTRSKLTPNTEYSHRPVRILEELLHFYFLQETCQKEECRNNLSLTHPSLNRLFRWQLNGLKRADAVWSAFNFCYLASVSGYPEQSQNNKTKACH